VSRKNKTEYDVTILSRDEVTTYPKLNQPATTVLVTYVAAGLPPHTLHIPKEGWSESKEKMLIRKSIEERLKARPEAYKV